MNRCDVCGEMKEEWETHNFEGGLVRCKTHSPSVHNANNKGGEPNDKR